MIVCVLFYGIISLNVLVNLKPMLLVGSILGVLVFDFDCCWCII